MNARFVLLAVLSALLFAQQPPAIRSFDRVQLLETTSENSAGVQVADLNGDGRLDIVLGKGRHGPLHNRVLLNDGKGGFAASNLGAAPDRTYSAALADLDLDGHLDIVVSNDEPDRKLLYRNDGKGRFTEFGTFGSPKWPTRYVTLADLNGDRYPDIIAANRGNPTPSYICLNDRTGHFPACDALPTESATSIVAADLDADGDLDLFVPHRDGGQSVVLWNDSKGHFTKSTKVGPPAVHARIGVSADFDGDHRPDLAYIDEHDQGAFILFNRKEGFSEAVRLPGARRTPYALSAADLNKDGHPDLIVGHVELPGAVYFNHGDGRAWTEVPWNDGKGVAYQMAFADFDGDGWPDIVSARSGAPNAIWFSGPGKTPAKK